MNKVKRYLCIVLVVVFVLSFAPAVFAATHQWEVNGELYTASATFTKESGNIAVFSGTKKSHIEGTATVLTAASDYSVTKSVLWSSTPQYVWHVKQAIINTGALVSATFTINAGQRVTVPANRISGEYAIVVEYFTHHGQWHVIKQSENQSTMLESGSFYDAPMITEYSYNFYKVS